MSSLLYPQLIASPSVDTSEHKANIINYAKGAVVIKIDNVARYLYEDCNQEEWDLTKDFPNLAPPFGTFWMEYKHPDYFNSEGHINRQPYELRTGRIGALFGVKEIPEDDKESGNAKWVYNIMTFLHFPTRNREIIQLPFFNFIGVTAGGEVATIEDRLFHLIGFSRSDIPTLDGLGISPDTAKKNTAMLYPMFLALSFMHCKNVEMVSKGSARSARNKKETTARVKIYTLEISPMRKVLENAGSKKTGIKQALHICRGHFKDFSKGRGLFGRYKGMYWWDSQVRGNTTYGTISKDYNINPEEK